MSYTLSGALKLNSFERHGIAHLSASTINLFASQPALFVMEKLLKRRGKVGCAAFRGNGAEAGIVHGLLDLAAPMDACQAAGVAEYDRLSILSADPRREKEREAVPKIIASALPELRAYGRPDMVQTKIEKMLDGVPVPFIGYVDLGWTTHGITLDVKSQLRLSSSISSGHARQVSLYIEGTNHQGRIAYCAPAKIGVYVLENQAAHIKDVVAIAKTMERFLGMSSDPLELAGIVCPDLDSFYYSDPMTRATAREVYGFSPDSAFAECATPGGAEQPAF